MLSSTDMHSTLVKLRLNIFTDQVVCSNTNAGLDFISDKTLYIIHIANDSTYDTW